MCWCRRSQSGCASIYVCFSVTGLQLEYSYVLYINLLEGPDREQHDTTVVDSEIEDKGERGYEYNKVGIGAACVACSSLLVYGT